MILGTAKGILQWGRGIAAAESRDVPRDPAGHQVASMGPRHCCRGITDPTNDIDIAAGASMGPRHWCRGIRRRASPSPRQPGSFNGAAALLPRNPGALQRRAHRLAASMGPRHCCRGIRRHSQRWPWAQQSFNGAAALLPRNLDRLAQIALRVRIASMGPRHCCRGISSR